jgi:type I restriction-modification system DNA methylase subunit
MSLIKSKKRVADHGEVFTPPWLVERMLELVKGERDRIDSRFLEPACGSGNFLVSILRHKLDTVELKYGRSQFEKRVYGLVALPAVLVCSAMRCFTSRVVWPIFRRPSCDGALIA